MNFKIQDYDYEVRISKTEMPVPVVNGVHLHSAYNPLKEAATFVEKNIITIESNNVFLILGLGFGYHINQLVLNLKKLYSNDFKIAVIEPNKKVASDCFSRGIIPEQENLKVFSSDRVDMLYQDEELVQFLAKKPSVLPHPASFNLYSDFYKKFMSYIAPSTIGFICSNLNESGIKDALLQMNPDSSSYELFTKLNDRKNLSDKEQLLLSFLNLAGNVSNPSEEING